MNLDTIAVSLGQCLLCVLFGLAAAEKARWIHQRVASWHPALLHWPHLRPIASIALASCAVLDLGVAIGMLLRPTQAAWVALPLVVAYTVAGSRIDWSSGGRCGCFFGQFEARSRIGLVARNTLLGIAALAVGLRTPSTPLLARAATAVSLVGLTVIAVSRDRHDRVEGLTRAER